MKLLCAFLMLAFLPNFIRAQDATEKRGKQVEPEINADFPQYPLPPEREKWNKLSGTERVKDVKKRLEPQLIAFLQEKDIKSGSYVFIRIFKESKELEVWMLNQEGKWVLFRNNRIAAMSDLIETPAAKLGPKLLEGDNLAPEGFYQIRSLNPTSRHHLSMDIGYPNSLDTHYKRTGKDIMIHGSNASSGCFTISNRVIEEVYLLAEAALKSGQKNIPVHIFPFRMTPQRMLMAERHKWHLFWLELQRGYDLFETTNQPPEIFVKDGHYIASRAQS